MRRLFRDEGPRGTEERDGMAHDDAVFAGVWWRRSVVREDPWEALRREVDRSRRHHHPLTLLRLIAPPRGRDGRRRKLMATMQGLRRAMRSVDSIWVDHDGIYMLLPESDRDAAHGLLGRLRDAASDAVPAGDAVRMACFPEDGLTANALRAAVGRELAGPPALVAGPAAEDRAEAEEKAVVLRRVGRSEGGTR
jgi:hypothetical protein